MVKKQKLGALAEAMRIKKFCLTFGKILNKNHQNKKQKKKHEFDQGHEINKVGETFDYLFF